MKPTIRRTRPRSAPSCLAVTAALDPREMHEAGRERSMLADLHDPLRYERWLGRFLWLGLLAVLLYISWS